MTSDFRLDQHIIHLNHAAVAPWPSVTRDAVAAFADENLHIGSQRYAEWMKVEQALKQKMQQLVNAESSDEIAILKNTSEGLSIIAQGLEFSQGDNIVIPDEEFPSNRIVWIALEKQGVEVRRISIETADSRSAEQRLIDAMDSNTRLLSCSSVQYARGLRMNLDVLGEACKQHGSLFCVDAIQSLGAMAFDAQACQADFVVADGHKWMCAPEGTALFYCRHEVQDQLRLTQHGWHMLEDAFEFRHSDTLDIASNAQRFESGSPNMMGIAALNASLGMLLDTGMDNIEQAVLANSRYLQQQLTKLDKLHLLSPTEPGRYAGITTFYRDNTDTLALYQHLQDNNVLCACRGGGIRFSPHFYTPKQNIDKAVALVAAYS